MTYEDWLTDQLPRLVRFARVLCGQDLAEEIVQDVAIKVHARWSTIETLEHREAYVRRMIVNEHLSWRRKWSRLIPQAEFVEPRPSGDPDFTDRHADRMALVSELDRLPRKQRAVLVLRYLEGLGDPEIAGLMGCSTATVRSNVSRGLAALRVEPHTTPGRRTAPEEGSRAH